MLVQLPLPSRRAADSGLGRLMAVHLVDPVEGQCQMLQWCLGRLDGSDILTGKQLSKKNLCSELDDQMRLLFGAEKGACPGKPGLTALQGFATTKFASSHPVISSRCCTHLQKK